MTAEQKAINDLLFEYVIKLEGVTIEQLQKAAARGVPRFWRDYSVWYQCQAECEK